ncbi:MAG: aromatic acid exporter family protein [Erysipelotrichaceae bacterium]|nr:aromatic acid exporter family protein [Erysipelotrichaceae bacterium]
MKRVVFNTMKIVLASIFAIVIAYSLDFSFYISCGIVTILTIQSTKKDTLHTAIERFIAFIIALVIAYGCFYFFGYTILAYCIYLVFYLFICQLCSWYSSMAVNSVLISHFLTFQMMTFPTIINELGLFGIGVSIGIMANLHLKKNTYIEDLKSQADNQIRYILLRMSKRIVQDIDEYDGSCFDVLYELISKAKTMSYENEKNSIFTFDDFDRKYISMRSKQTQVLYEMYKIIRNMHTTPFTAKMISEFLNKIANEYHLKNDCEQLLDEFYVLDAKMKSTPLPVERNEFEDRARLFVLLRRIEEFLLIKREFYKNVYSLNEKEK